MKMAFLIASLSLLKCSYLYASEDYVTKACLNEISRVIRPAAVALTGDAHADVSDQGMPLVDQRAKDAGGAEIYYKPLWKVVGSYDGYYHLNAGAYIVLAKDSCKVVGIKLEPDTF